jgi:hypothetical protein
MSDQDSGTGLPILPEPFLICQEGDKRIGLDSIFRVGAPLTGGIVYDAWGVRAKAFFESYKHFGGFDDV